MLTIFDTTILTVRSATKQKKATCCLQANAESEVLWLYLFYSFANSLSILKFFLVLFFVTADVYPTVALSSE